MTATVSIAEFADRIQAANAARKAAREQLDTAAESTATADRDAALAEAIVAIRALTGTTDISPTRAAVVVRAAAAGATPLQLKRIADACRTSEQASGILLPAGRYEGLSRGRGWARRGTGSDVEWGTREDGGYRVATEGTWTIGSTDGFSRKDATQWKVSRVAGVWIAD
jgi:hypothetical protein